ncbi:hypothetical protein J7E83_07275 [Arthrobacter sp. ISL-48]|uniref:hypothetical protein n=1 Tax=Arthrobacter sp. ISL-48 TaxID=2819110 RepID=UPI001BE6C838|nr:hypothetical protein [Arthrobacter sp. ISL-48]MBT2531925.1 hypothetical protein [Arthrobacter sp. ISL-48]
MVDYRSELSRSRTGIHGGLQRGTAAAAIGVVLVLSAGVPASQADDSPDSGEPEIQVTGTAQLPAVGGLLNGLLGSVTQPATTPPTTTTPSPTGTGSPAPVPVSPAAPGPATVSQTPATSSAPGTQAVPGATATGQQASSGTATADPRAVPAPGQQQPGSGSQIGGGQPADQQSAGQQSADQQGAAGAEAGGTGQPTSSVTTPTAGSTSRSGSLHAAGTPAGSRPEMAPASEPAAGTAKVWLGVGLLGSAGAAGLVFARIRRS